MKTKKKNTLAHKSTTQKNTNLPNQYKNMKKKFVVNRTFTHFNKYVSCAHVQFTYSFPREFLIFSLHFYNFNKNNNKF